MKNYFLDRVKRKNTNARLLDEARECEKRWAKTGLLNKLGFLKEATAVLLESQRLCNEMPKEEKPGERTIKLGWPKRIS